MQKYSPVFLIGPRASGKSSVARLLARHLGRPLFDTDFLVAAEAGCTIAEIVAKEGWDSFREREARVLRAACLSGGIIATGGGMVLSMANREFMRQQGTVVYLSASPECLHSRLSADLNPGLRPSLTGNDPLEEVRSVLAEREPLYISTAHHILDASLSRKAVARLLMRILEQNEGVGS